MPDQPSDATKGRLRAKEQHPSEPASGRESERFSAAARQRGGRVADLGALAPTARPSMHVDCNCFREVVRNAT